MKKSILFLVLLMAIVPFLHGQKKDIPEWYLEFLYDSYGYKCNNFSGYPLLWEAEISKKFLIKKIQENPKKINTLTFMGSSKDSTFVPYILPFLKDEKYQRNAIGALLSIGSKESINALEKLLIQENIDEIVLSRIIHGLQLNAYMTSIEPLKTFIAKKTNKKELRQQAEQALEIIMFANQSIEAKRAFVTKSLYSNNNNDDVNWSIFNIKKSKDNYYLPALRKVSAKMDINQSTLYRNILKLRLELGDKDFNREEEAFIQKNKLYPILKQMDLVQEEINYLETQSWIKKD